MAATINNVVIPNVAKGTADRDNWHGIYALTRALKKAGWKVRASSDGSSKLVDDSPELDKFGAGATTGVSGVSATFAAPVNGRVVVTGLSGIGGTALNPHKGMFLRGTNSAQAGNNHDHQIEEILSPTSVAIDARRAAFTPAAAADVDWEIFDPTEGLAPTQPFSSGTHAWIVLEGPRMIKVPITAAPTPGTDFDFIRGENVVQAVTGAEGEFYSYVFDSGAGYACIAPRVYGSGADPTGWATTNAITGDTSGATLTQVGTAVEYVFRLVIMKDGNFEDGWMAIQCIDPIGETADDFVTLAASVGCTAVIAPGQGGTGNLFPLLCTIMLGNNDSALGEEWCGDSTGIIGNTQIVCLDVLPEAKHTGEGSWFQATYMSPDNEGAMGHGLYLMLDGEPGDQLCPYVWQSAAVNVAQSVGNATFRRTTAPDGTPTNDQWGGNTHETEYTNGDTPYRSWRARGSGLVADDQAIALEVLALTPVYETDQRGIHVIDSGLPFTVRSSPASPKPKQRSPIWLGHFAASTNKFVKGRFKNLTQVSLGGYLDTYDTGTAIGLSSSIGPFVWEPWDGVSIAVAN